MEPAEDPVLEEASADPKDPDDFQDEDGAEALNESEALNGSEDPENGGEPLPEETSGESDTPDGESI